MPKHILEDHIVATSSKGNDVPVFLKGLMGTVIAVTKQEPGLAVHVRFDDKGFGAFAAESLLILKPPAVLKACIAKKGITLSKEDKKLAHKIIQLLELDEEELAFKYAAANKALTAFCFTTCKGWLSMQQPNKSKRKLKP